MIRLSILICTIPEREKYRKLLDAELNRQIDELGVRGQVEIIYAEEPRGSKSVGFKRNDNVYKALGLYVIHIDDDDFPANNYLSKIWEAMKSDADIITFNMNYYESGKYVRKYIINRFIGESFTESEYIIDRIFFHLCAIKRDIANKVKFPDANFQEDLAYSYEIKPLLKTEHRINECLYNYYFDKELSATRN